MNARLVSRPVLPMLAVLTLVLVAWLLTLSISSAQSPGGGAIEGTAVDPNGVGVSGATVTVTRPGGRSVSVTTNGEGYFRIPQLDPGRYTVTVEGAPGFASFEQSNVEVNASRTTKLTLNIRVAAVSETVTVPESSGAAVQLTPTSVGGAIEFKFDTTKFGTLKAYLPDDIRPGDTVSGSLIWEKAQVGQTVEVKSPNSKVTATANQFTVSVPTELPPSQRSYVHLALLAPSLTEGAAPAKATLFIPVHQLPAGSSTDFIFPAISQQGRAVEIQGPFDGNSANTGLKFLGPNLSKPGEGTGSIIKLLAESPRKVIFVAPVDVTGPYIIEVKEGDKTLTGNSRNIAVNLSAPKTNLMRGEKTTVTIQVSGLAGILNDVPLQLDARGVINMDGGNFQNLRIKPDEIKLDGRYTTDRMITGLQAGGFNVTATVVVGLFDIALQDDNDPNRLFHFNSFTGNYVFACGGGSCRSGAGGASSQPPAGSSVAPPPVTLTGIGKPQMKGCIITLSHNAPDRRVFARLDACAKTGDASVETTSPKSNFNIMDKNTADNTAVAPPPK